MIKKNHSAFRGRANNLHVNCTICQFLFKLRFRLFGPYNNTKSSQNSKKRGVVVLVQPLPISGWRFRWFDWTKSSNTDHSACSLAVGGILKPSIWWFQTGWNLHKIKSKEQNKRGGCTGPTTSDFRVGIQVVWLALTLTFFWQEVFCLPERPHSFILIAVICSKSSLELGTPGSNLFSP